MRHLSMAAAILAIFAGTGSPAAQSATSSILPFAAPAGLIRVLAIGGNGGNQAANQVFTGGFLSGSCTRLNDTAAFNAMTPAQIRASYDVLLCTWAGDPALNLDWTTRLLPFLQLGGGIVFEDPENVGDLAPAVSAYEGGFGGPYLLSPVPGLTEGILGNFVNDHISIAEWDPGIFTPFMSNGYDTLGLLAQVAGGGRMLVTAPDQDYHSLDSPPDDQFNFLVNEILWVSPVGARFANLRSSVLALVGPGKLSASYAATMNNLLTSAESRYNAKQYAQAVTLIRTFLTYVARAQTSGWITAAEAAVLRGRANSMIASLSPVGQ